MKYIADITDIDLEMFIKGNIKKHKLTDIVISVFFDELDLSKNIFAVQEKKNDEGIGFL